MSNSSIDDRELRERVEKRLKARQEFTIHLTVYIIANLFLWFLWFLMTGIGVGGEALAAAGFPWPLIVMGGWGIGLVIHGLDVYSKTSAAALRYEARVQQEMELERQRIAEIRGELLEKPKRRARLAEDGEIVYEDDEQQYSDEPPVRRARRGE